MRQIFSNTLQIPTVSKLFQPIISSPSKIIKNDKVTSLSQKLLIDAGIIHQAHNGLFQILPLGIRAIKKLTAFVENNLMNELGAQQVSIPSLTSAELWKLTGRMELAGVELFKLIDRHKKEFVLAPTHEESIANLLSSLPILSHRELPLLLYQITNKYRDEMRPRFGLIRSKEFLMKDLYSFDKDHDSATDTYQRVSKCYENIFNKIGIQHMKVDGDTGLMGGSYSHEYHYPAAIGDDTLIICGDCNKSWNEILYKELKNALVCQVCGSSNMKHNKGIEVGHTFLLGTNYSKVLGAQYINSSQNREDLHMGSYGLGITRIIAAALENLSSDNGLRWPEVFAPYSLLIITPKEGSKEFKVADQLFGDILQTFKTIDFIRNDFIIDDRNHMTIGRRLAEAKLTGYPKIVIIGKTILEQPPSFEYYELNSDLKLNLSYEDLINQITNWNINNGIKNEDFAVTNF